MQYYIIYIFNIILGKSCQAYITLTSKDSQSGCIGEYLQLIISVPSTKIFAIDARFERIHNYLFELMILQ